MGFLELLIYALISIHSSFAIDHLQLKHLAVNISIAYHRNSTKVQNICRLQTPLQATRDFMSDRWTPYMGDTPILVHSPCFGVDSLGNALSNYLESVLCARISGAYYLAVSKIWEPRLDHKTNSFFDTFPSLIPARDNFSKRQVQDNMEKHCRCTSNCHSKKDSLWTSNINLIKKLLNTAVDNYVTSMANNASQTVLTNDDLSNAAVGRVLPFAPDVAIHYRCSDNFVGLYGFLPFSAFLNHIPHDVKTIYVLAEKKNRKLLERPHLIEKCNAVFESLFAYLSKNFGGTATILIRRGDDALLDFSRLIRAKTLICSVSTFCLWAAVANNGMAYMPQTRLVADGNTDLTNLGFRWIQSPRIVISSMFANKSPKSLLAALNDD